MPFPYSMNPPYHYEPTTAYPDGAKIDVFAILDYDRAWYINLLTEEQAKKIALLMNAAYVRGFAEGSSSNESAGDN